MKKIILSTILLFLACIVVFTACKKEDNQKNRTEVGSETKSFLKLKQNLFDYNYNFNSSHTSVQNRPWYAWAAIGVMDLMGGVEGGKIGSAFGPWGTLIGGVLGGAATSYVSAKNENNPGDSSVNVYNSANIYDVAGRDHNRLMLYLDSNSNKFILEDTISTGLLLETIREGMTVFSYDVSAFDTLDFSYPVNYVLESKKYSLDSIYINTQFNSFKFNNTNLSNEIDIIEIYTLMAVKCNGINQLSEYSTEFEYIVNISNVSESSKAFILTNISIFKHSLAYWHE